VVIVVVVVVGNNEAEKGDVSSVNEGIDGGGGMDGEHGSGVCL
jgi:hypothetical protein